MVHPEDGVKGLKMLYKYMYYATSTERQHNPEWGNLLSKWTGSIILLFIHLQGSLCRLTHPFNALHFL